MALVFAAGLTLAAASPARASDALLGQAVPVASAQWPASPCSGREVVVWTPQAEIDAAAPDERLGAIADPPRCSVRLSDEMRVLDGPRLCALLQHEFGHLAGRMHTDDPSDVMHHGTIPWTMPCTLAFPPVQALSPGWRCSVHPGPSWTILWKCRRPVRASSGRCRRRSHAWSGSSARCKGSGSATARATRRAPAA